MFSAWYIVKPKACDVYNGLRLRDRFTQQECFTSLLLMLAYWLNISD
ncbi:hypothetical protein [uncultured Nostoc sp.]